MIKTITHCAAAGRWVCLSILLLLTTFAPSSAQQWQIGTGTGSNTYDGYPTPFGNYYSGARSQFIYRASEMLAAGMTAGPIHQLAFNVVALNATQPHLDFSVNMKPITANNLAAGFQSAMVTYYSSASYMPVMGWNTFTLSTPFIWNGTDNIVVETCFWNGTFNYTESPSVQWTTGLGGNTSRDYYADEFGPFCTYTGTSNNYARRPNIRFTRLLDCNAPPTAGTASAPSPVCAAPFNLTLTGQTIGNGITIQWQSSPPGAGTWTNIGTLNANPLSVTQTTATDYRAVVTCTLPGGGSANSNVVAVAQNNFLNCYCTPVYDFDCGIDYISNVTLATINNNTGCGGSPPSNLTLYSTPNPTLNTGYSYPLSVTTDGDDEGVSVWIDFNRNGLFEQSEAVIYNQFQGTTPATYTATVTVPSNASLGQTRMRVRCEYFDGAADPCGLLAFGETEDYFVTIAYAPPPPTIVVTGAAPAGANKHTICSGNNITLTASSTESNPSFSWTGPGITTPVQSATLTLNNVSTTQAGVYKATVTVNNATSMAATDTLIVNPAPATPIAISDTVCQGENAELTVNAQSGLTYKWYDAPTGGSSVATGASLTVTNVTANVVRYVTASNTQCESQRAIAVAGLGTPPEVNLGNDTAFCQSIPLILDGGNPGGSYTWSTGAHTQTIQVTEVSGKYWVEVDKYCKRADTVEVTIAPLPSANGISYLRNVNTYSFSPANDQAVDDYLWIFGDGDTSTLREPVHTYSNGDIYDVSLVISNECGTDTLKLTLPLALSSVGKGSEWLKLYPNPATNQLTVEMPATVSCTELTVINSVGMHVLSAKYDQGQPFKKQQLNIADLPTGHYILRLQTSNGLVNKPFQVIR